VLSLLSCGCGNDDDSTSLLSLSLWLCELPPL